MKMYIELTASEHNLVRSIANIFEATGVHRPERIEEISDFCTSTIVYGEDGSYTCSAEVKESFSIQILTWLSGICQNGASLIMGAANTFKNFAKMSNQNNKLLINGKEIDRSRRFRPVKVKVDFDDGNTVTATKLVHLDASDNEITEAKKELRNEIIGKFSHKSEPVNE